MCQVPEPSNQQPSQEHTNAFSIGIHNVLTGPPHEGELGDGLLLRTDRGDIQAIIHQSPDAQRGVIWVCGARGGFGGPGKGAYARLSEVLRRESMVLWYLPDYKIVIISTTYAYMSMSQNVGGASS